MGFSDPLATSLVAAAGYDFVIIDMEHNPLSAAGITGTVHLVGAASQGKCSPLVRVPAHGTRNHLVWCSVKCRVSASYCLWFLSKLPSYGFLESTTTHVIKEGDRQKPDGLPVILATADDETVRARTSHSKSTGGTLEYLRETLSTSLLLNEQPQF